MEVYKRFIELVGFIDISSVRVSGTPDCYKFITMEENK